MLSELQYQKTFRTERVGVELEVSWAGAGCEDEEERKVKLSILAIYRSSQASSELSLLTTRCYLPCVWRFSFIKGLK